MADNYNNKFNLTLDTDTPSASITISNAVTVGSSKYINGNTNHFSISSTHSKAGSSQNASYMRLWEGSTEPSTWETFATTKTLSSSNLTAGTHTIKLRTVDNLGNESAVASYTYIVDSTPPTGLSAAINSNNIITNKSNVLIAISAIDASSQVDKFKVESGLLLSDVEFTATNGSYSGSLTIDTSASEGTHQVKVTAYDKVGNPSYITFNVVVDTIVTELSVLLYSSSDLNNSISRTNVTSIKYKATFNTGTAASSDIEYIRYKIDSGSYSNWAAVTVGASTYTSDSIGISSLTDGAHTITVQGKDVHGYTTNEVVSNLTIDRHAPRIGVTLNKYYFKGEDSVILTIDKAGDHGDDYSDLTSIAVAYTDENGTSKTVYPSLGSGSTITYTMPSDINLLDNTNNDPFAIAVTAIDDLGNYYTNTVYYNTDNIDPQLSLTGLNSLYNNKNNISLTLSYNDSFPSKNVYVWISTSNSITTVPSGISRLYSDSDAITSPVTLSKLNINGLTDAADGTYYVHVHATDLAGNARHYVSSGFTIDTAAPTVEIRFENNIIKSNGSINPTVDVMITYKDTYSGVYSYSWTGTGIVSVDGNNSSNNTNCAFTDPNPTSTIKQIILPVVVTAAAGQKTLNMTFTDTAGNTTSIKSTSVTVDVVSQTASITLLDTSGNAKSSLSNDPLFKARIQINAGTNDLTSSYYYCMYGNFHVVGDGINSGISAPTNDQIPTLYQANTSYAVGKFILLDGKLYYVKAAISATESPAITANFISTKLTEITASTDYLWKLYTKDSNQSYMTINNLTCTNNASEFEGESKTVNLLTVDNSGHITDEVSASFRYDDIAPLADYANLDYNDISLSNTYRRTGVSTVSETKKNNEVNFIFTTNENILEYRVCAFASRTAAEAYNPSSYTLANDTNIIGKVANATSINTYYEFAANTTERGPFNVKITGHDLDAMFGADGIKIIVIFVKDKSNTWNTAQSEDWVW